MGTMPQWSRKHGIDVHDGKANDRNVATNLRIRDFERVVFFTGAGMSAESGVPTYRGAGGIWKEYDYGKYACQEAFDRDPDAVWEFHNYRRDLVSKCSPNRGHELIALAERARPDVTVVTQNIDGLHQEAGSRNVHELHGSLWRVRCDQCGNYQRTERTPLEGVHCSACHAFWRPDITWFGDALRQEVLRDAAMAVEQADLLVAIGTSGVVMPAAALPLLAKRNGATLIEINPQETEMSDSYDFALRGTATEMLTVLTEGLEPADQDD